MPPTAGPMLQGKLDIVFENALFSQQLAVPLPLVDFVEPIDLWFLGLDIPFLTAQWGGIVDINWSVTLLPATEPTVIPIDIPSLHLLLATLITVWFVGRRRQK